MNFLIELGFDLCTFNFKVFESMHSSFNYPMQAFSVSCWCFHQNFKSFLGGLKNLRILHHRNSELRCVDCCFFTSFFFFSFINLIQILLKWTVFSCRWLPYCKNAKYQWLARGASGQTQGNCWRSRRGRHKQMLLNKRDVSALTMLNMTRGFRWWQVDHVFTYKDTCQSFSNDFAFPDCHCHDVFFNSRYEMLVFHHFYSIDQLNSS